MNQIFATIFCQLVQRLWCNNFLCKFLPAVGHDIIFPVFAAAAGEVQHKPLPAGDVEQLLEPVDPQFSVGENETRHDQLRGARLEPLRRIIAIHAAAELQAARPGRQRALRGLVVAGAELDDMPAGQVVAPVELGVPGGVVLRHEIGPGRRTGIGQRGADDLFDLSVVQVDAGAEKTHSTSGSR